MTLKEMRLNANLSRAQVGKRMNVDLSCVTHWELGDWKPARKLHKKLAKLYGVTLDDLAAAMQGENK